MSGFTLEELSINAWPALQTIVYDGWVLRMADAYAHRANSISPIYPSKLEIEEKVKYCEELYNRHSIPVAYKLTSYDEHKKLDEFLTKRGYSFVNETSLQICDIKAALESLASMPPVEGIIVSNTFSVSWIQSAALLTNTPEKFIPVFKQILANIKPEKIVVQKEMNGKIIGCGCGVIERNHVGIYDIAVQEDFRRRGFGREIVKAILAEALKRNVEKTYLQVMLNNAAALSLYGKMGYKETYRYWYRKRV